MTKLYLDCDGVILDTINMSYKMLKEKGIEREEEKKDFYLFTWKTIYCSFYIHYFHCFTSFYDFNFNNSLKSVIV